MASSDRPSSRRQFLGRMALGSLHLAAWSATVERLTAQAACTDPPEGELLAVLPLYGVGAAATPLGRMVGGGGLDARLFTDVSALTPDTLTTPTPEVFVRTAASGRLREVPPTWDVSIGGADGFRLSAAELAAAAQPMGRHLIECAGNSNPENFGLMSAVEWSGVPLARVLDRVPRPGPAAAVLVSGLDDDTTSVRSVPGASWILTPAAIEQRAPFLAVGMNGRPLTPDHGAPVRLVVPGWYGCAWIKWVNEIRWVGADEPATSQMREYASRTHQNGRPTLASDYAAPAIDTAAMPIRVEQRRVGGRVEYRVVGVIWGGTRVVDQLVIRFGTRDPGTPFAVCPAPRSHHAWSLWTYRWRPESPGYYDITLRPADASVPARRLDLAFYVRRVRIDAI
jgi:DMSO/TMAO reductase YedYZ molybdopterin-dependent catalytic subunit